MQILVSLSNIRAGLGVYTNVGFATQTEKKPEYVRIVYTFRKEFCTSFKGRRKEKKDVVDQPTPTRAHYPPLK